MKNTSNDIPMHAATTAPMIVAVSEGITEMVVVMSVVHSAVAYLQNATSGWVSSSARRHMLHKPYDVLTTKAPMWLGNWLQLRWHSNPWQLIWWVALVAQWGWMH